MYDEEANIYVKSLKDLIRRLSNQLLSIFSEHPQVGKKQEGIFQSNLNSCSISLTDLGLIFTQNNTALKDNSINNRKGRDTPQFNNSKMVVQHDTSLQETQFKVNQQLRNQTIDIQNNKKPTFGGRSFYQRSITEITPQMNKGQFRYDKSDKVEFRIQNPQSQQFEQVTQSHSFIQLNYILRNSLRERGKTYQKLPLQKFTKHSSFTQK